MDSLNSYLVLAKQRNELKNPIKFQAILYATLDNSFATESYISHGEGYGLTKGVVQMVHRFYTTEAANGNILFTPLQASNEDLTGLPAALILAAEADVLRSGKYNNI
jgi:acetyl esterase/lipase